jgi:acyl-CoA synthetase (AMP-forming)/AMP-acid ligase II
LAGDNARAILAAVWTKRFMGPTASKTPGKTLNLAPAPILDLFEKYAGTFHDLDRGLTLDGAQLRSARGTLAAAITRHKHSVTPGDRVLMAVGNGPGFLTAFVAVLSVGGAPVLLHVDTPPAELERLSRSYDARFALCDAWTASDLSPFAESITSVEIAPGAQLTFAALRPGADDSRTLPKIAGMPLHPTSGTTGVPKLAARHGLAAIAEAANYREAMDLGADDTIFCVVPMSHAYGFGACAMLSLVSGASVVSSRRFQPHVVFRTFRERPITTFPAVPAMLHLLLVASRGPIERLPRRVLSAGAPLAGHTAREFLEKNGQTAWSLYGSTETGGICVDVDAPPDAEPGSVGPTMRPVSVDIRPLADTRDWKPGIGHVCVKSPSMMAGYLTPNGIDATPIREGWFQTGDLGFIDPSGRVHLVGRESEVVNVFGMKVIPSEVESVIRDFPGVTDVKVYAGQHRSGSQIVKAAVAGPSIDVAALREHCAAQLVAYKRPEIIIPLDALPRTPTGKIIKDQLP